MLATTPWEYKGSKKVDSLWLVSTSQRLFSSLYSSGHPLGSKLASSKCSQIRTVGFEPDKGELINSRVLHIVHVPVMGRMRFELMKALRPWDLKSHAFDQTQPPSLIEGA